MHTPCILTIVGVAMVAVIEASDPPPDRCIEWTTHSWFGKKECEKDYEPQTSYRYIFVKRHRCCMKLSITTVHQ